MAAGDGIAAGDPAGYPQTDRPVTVPLHAPGEMTLDAEYPVRRECWERLDSSLRVRLYGLAGIVLAWWAQIVDLAKPPEAVVFGEAGLFVAAPAEEGGEATHSVFGYELIPGSLSTDIVEHSPAPDEVSAATGSGGSADVPGPEIAGLSPAVKAVLGNLPPRAQHLMQAPFAGGQEIRVANFHYEGWAGNFESFTLLLVGDQDVTVASGTMLIPEGHSSATAHWSLRIHRALVRPWAG